MRVWVLLVVCVFLGACTDMTAPEAVVKRDRCAEIALYETMWCQEMLYPSACVVEAYRVCQDMSGIHWMCQLKIMPE